MGRDDHLRVARDTKGAFDYVLPEFVPEVSSGKVTLVRYARSWHRQIAKQCTQGVISDVFLHADNSNSLLPNGQSI